MRGVWNGWLNIQGKHTCIYSKISYPTNIDLFLGGGGGRRNIFWYCRRQTQHKKRTQEVKLIRIFPCIRYSDDVDLLPAEINYSPIRLLWGSYTDEPYKLKIADRLNLYWEPEKSAEQMFTGLAGNHFELLEVATEDDHDCELLPP